MHTDCKYITALLENDTPLIKALYQKNYPAAEKYVLYKGGDSELADDLFQRAIILVYEKAMRLHQKAAAENQPFECFLSAPVGAYLLGIVDKLLREHFRKDDKYKNNALLYTESIAEIATFLQEEKIIDYRVRISENETYIANGRITELLKSMLAEMLVTDEQFDRIAPCLEKLPPYCTSLLEMRLLDQLPLSEIARIKESNNNAIGVRINKCLTKLRECYNK